MFKKMDEEDYKKFWEQFSTNVKLGVIEDSSNKTRLAKLLRCVYVYGCVFFVYFDTTGAVYCCQMKV